MSAEPRGNGRSASTSDDAAGRRDAAGWATLPHILHGRTLHIHALSPLHKPRRGHWGEEEEEEERDQGEGDDDEVLGQTDLDDMASQLYSFLSLRLNASIFAPPAVVNGNSTGREGAAASGSDLSLDTGDGRPWTASAGGMIKTVRAAFVQMPLTARPAAQRHTDPPPWAVEIELEPLPDANDLMTPTSQAQRHRKTHIERAHLVFLSSPRRISSTHYPLLIWKAPAPRLGLSGTAGATDGMGEDAASSMHQLTSRALVTHMLGFVARYFDCRLSHLAPLCSLRGRGLETVANGILRSMRAEEYEVQDESRGDDDFGGPAQQHSVDLTYALPLHVAEEDSSDDDNDDTGPRESIRTDRRASDNVNDPRKRRRRDVKPGPAPELNSISLTVPHAVVQSLLHRTPTDTPLLPALEAYLDAHTSLQLHRLALVRVGLAGVFLGAPPSAATAGSGEVRLKFTDPSSIRGGRRRQKPSEVQASGGEASIVTRRMENRMAAVLQLLVAAADGTRW